MDILFIIVSFIVLITIIVGIHELGHFLTARFFKIHVLKFKIGFGKEIFSFQDKHNCSYSFGVLPLGGYVQMLGESNPVQEDSSPNFSDKKSYLDASPGERAAVTVAGPLANFILAGFVYFYLALVGTTQLSSYIGDVVPGSLVEEAGLISGDRIIEVDQDRIDIFNDINLTLSKRIGDTGTINIKFLREGIERNTVVSISEWLEDDEQKSPSAALGMLPFMPPLVGQLQEDGPAYKYGLMQGDLIQAVNNEKIVTWQDLSKNLNALPDQLIELMVLREGEQINLVLESSSYIDDEGQKKGRIGILASRDLNQWPSQFTVEKKENIFSAFFVGIQDTYKYTLLIITSIGKMISGSISADNLGGPIQISVLAGSAAKAGYITFLSMIALLSINLGLLNLLPIPILDGGQLLMIAIEKLKGSPVSDIALEYSMRVGIILVVSLMIFAFANDIARLI
ncbi:MAG: putative zinc metalloprotease [Gammaproteobacteria bacterium]|nr:MAG: putative zinc metalloprotease [Gammaproteobacteria bacterium]